MTAASKLLFLEIDAGDRELIRRWADDGTMPTFRRLLSRGLVGDTMSLEGFFVGATWPSLYTGVNPARHGIHSLVQQKPGTYEFLACPTGEHVKREPFWNHLSRAGRRMAILDIPLSGLARDLNGIQSVEWGSHDCNYGFCAWPKDFEADILNRFGRNPLAQSCNAYGRTPADFVAFSGLLRESVRVKSALTRHYLAQGGWDFFAQVFTESHCVGHQCWHLHDAAHPGHDPAVASVTGDPIRDVYRAIDAAIGEVIDAAGDDATIIVLAGHRMAHKFGAQFLLPDILVRLGVANLRATTASESRLERSLTEIWARLPAGTKSALATPKRWLRNRFDQNKSHGALPPSVSRLDAARSQVFLTDNGFPHSGLRLNLRGREPAGLLDHGDDAETFSSELTRQLLDLRYADTGGPVVDAVKRTRDLYAGEYLDQLPDLIVEWNESRPLGSATCGNPAGSHVVIQSPAIGTVEGTNTYCRTGDHRREGMFIATGPRIDAGRLTRNTSIMDFAPTFCAFLGAPLPDADGQPIAEIIAARPV
jgi:predicted AlkP superfamily phosphohydrolase/phosphomutase